jgi:hypothetical protein
VIAVLISLAAAAQAPPAATLADCSFRLAVGEPNDAEAGTFPFALLFEAPREGQSSIISARVHDPKGMLEGLPIMGGFYSRGGKILSFRTDERRPVYFRIGLLSGPGGKRWAGAIQIDGAVAEEQRLAASYMGECTIDAPADAVARFEALEANR